MEVFHGFDPGWRQALAPLEEHLKTVLQTAYGKADREILPPRHQVFQAFTYPFEEVKVLIVGQDPYPNPGHAMGLAFSVNPGIRPPRSLQNIYRELQDDLGIQVPKDCGDLRPWAKNGVCLLNRVFSLEAGRPGSHEKIAWQKLSDEAVKALVARKKPLVALLWGRGAQSLKPLLASVPIIESAHPSPLSARRGFFGSRPFSKANLALQASGATPVDWRLDGVA